MDIYKLIEKCDEEDKKGLEWFREHNGETDIPFTLKYDGVNLLSSARGIYKPANSECARSVKETLKMKYPDRDPIYFQDGSWLYIYHQQGEDPNGFDNVALKNNIERKIPVGVVIQTKEKGKGGARYSIGFGLPIGWIEGFFIIYCANKDGLISDEVLKKPIGELFNSAFVPSIEESLGDEGEFDPKNVDDSRKRTLKGIKIREGQPEFRRGLLNLYNEKCVVTGCEVKEVLEAAHITPYKGKETNDISNGLLLRADIHTLWDKYLLTIDANDLTVRIHPEIQADKNYSKLAGMKISLPENRNLGPSLAALEYHNSLCVFS